MFVAQKIVAKQRIVGKTLEYHIQEAGLAQVQKPTAPFVKTT